MAIEGLKIIGESINDSVPGTKRLFDAGDVDGILELARMQDERGAAFIDVNVGSRPPEFMAEMIRRIQGVTAKPLAVDTPDMEIARAGLGAYDQQRAGGEKPILNSVSLLRTEMLDLYEVQPFRPILLASEFLKDGQSGLCRTADETYQTARQLVAAARQRGMTNDDFIIDGGIAPLGGDIDGHLKRLLAALEMIHNDPDLAGVHASVGLSNFTVGLPPKRADGTPTKSPLESAFLTRAMPLGLDMVVANVKRKYQVLPPDHPAMVCVEGVLNAEGFDAIILVQGFYS